MNLPEVKIEDLLEAGVHFGHNVRRWNPKMENYIFGVRNNIHIFDLRITLEALNVSLVKIHQTVSNSGNILFVGTEFGMFYSINGGVNWNNFKDVPTIAIRDLEIHEGEDDLVAASFGRGFYIVDDYSPIREVSKDFLSKDAHLFSVKDALQFVIASPEKSATGHNFFTSPNPPYGVKLSYYLKKMERLEL